MTAMRPDRAEDCQDRMVAAEAALKEADPKDWQTVMKLKGDFITAWTELLELHKTIKI